MTVVVCAQIALSVGDVAGNRGRMRLAVQDAARAGAHVVVLPELTNSGYAFSAEEEARALSEPADGPTPTEWCELAEQHDLVLVGGFCEAAPDGTLRNSAAIVDRRGVRAVYRKVHLWDAEKLVFTPGNEPPPVVDTAVGRVSTIICYDAEFPEWVRLVGLAGAELLCVPTNWPWLGTPAEERPLEVVRVQAAAAANRMFVAACDRTGAERSVHWVGGSVVVDCDGRPLAGPACERSGPVRADIECVRARDKRISAHNDVHADRRPELYGEPRGSGRRPG